MVSFIERIYQSAFMRSIKKLEERPLKMQYYQSHLIATVKVENGHISVEGGQRESQKLSAAKRDSDFCYVKDARTGDELKLVLVDDEWAAA